MKLKSILLETVVDKELQQEFELLGKLSNEFEELVNKLDAIKKQRDPLLEKFSALVEDTRDEVLQSKQYTMMVKRKGYERFNPSYKLAFTEALKKVNAATRKILEGILADATTISKVGPTLKIIKNAPIDEIKLIDFLKNLGKKMVNWYKDLRNLKKYNSDLKKLAMQVK